MNRNTEDRIKTMLGFASKAGQLITGTAAVTDAIKKQRVFLVICADDLASRTLRNFQLLCEQNKILFFRFGARFELGHWIGHPDRGIIGVVSKQFASTIGALLQAEMKNIDDV